MSLPCPDVNCLLTTQNRLAAAKMLAGHPPDSAAACTQELSDEALLARNDPRITEWVFQRRKRREQFEREKGCYKPTDVAVYTCSSSQHCNSCS